MNMLIQTAGHEGTRITWLDTIKGIGIILVVLGHVYKNDFVYNWIYSFHMPVFFFTAGCVYREKPILQDIKRRIETIVRPYFVFGVVGLLYWCLIERRFRESDMSIPQAVAGLFRGQYSWLDFNVHLWFLPCFFVTVILFNLLRKKLGLKPASAISLVLCVIYLSFNLPELPWGLDRVCKYIIFFALGVVAIPRIQTVFSGQQKISKKVIFIAIGVVLLSLIAFLAQDASSIPVLWYVTAILGISGCVFVSAGIDCRLLEYLGRTTIVVLCFHGPIYRVLVKIEAVIFRITTDDVRSNILLVVSVIIATFVSCLVIYQIVRKWMPWVIGRKKREVIVDHSCKEEKGM